jgi:hypothetical protein
MSRPPAKLSPRTVNRVAELAVWPSSAWPMTRPRTVNGSELASRTTASAVQRPQVADPAGADLVEGIEGAVGIAGAQQRRDRRC